jgi:hypothetical protein
MESASTPESNSPPAAAAAAAVSGDPAAAACREELLTLLREGGRGAANRSAQRVRALIGQLERDRPADLARDGAWLKGVWELRWSSSSLPYLAVAPWLENLQLLDPERGRGMNLLRLAGPLGPLAGIAVQARIAVEGAQRVSVRFERGGWLGPSLGDQRLELFRQVNQSYPAWLDITVLDRELRVCRGNAGTLFALLRREDLAVEDLL